MKHFLFILEKVQNIEVKHTKVKLQEGKLRLDIRTSRKIEEQWNRLAEEVVGSPCLHIFQTWVEKALAGMR